MAVNGVTHAIDKELKVCAFDISTGTKKWESVSFQVPEFDGSNMAMVAGKDKIYLQHRDNQVIEMDLGLQAKLMPKIFYWAGDQGPIRDFQHSLLGELVTIVQYWFLAEMLEVRKMS